MDFLLYRTLFKNTVLCHSPCLSPKTSCGCLLCTDLTFSVHLDLAKFLLLLPPNPPPDALLPQTRIVFPAQGTLDWVEIYMATK